MLHKGGTKTPFLCLGLVMAARVPAAAGPKQHPSSSPGAVAFPYLAFSSRRSKGSDKCLLDHCAPERGSRGEEAVTAVVLLFSSIAWRRPRVLAMVSSVCFPSPCEEPTELTSPLVQQPQQKKMSPNGHQVLISCTAKSLWVGNKWEGCLKDYRWSLLPLWL